MRKPISGYTVITEKMCCFNLQQSQKISRKWWYMLIYVVLEMLSNNMSLSLSSVNKLDAMQFRTTMLIQLKGYNSYIGTVFENSFIRWNNLLTIA